MKNTQNYSYSMLHTPADFKNRLESSITQTQNVATNKKTKHISLSPTPPLLFLWSPLVTTPMCKSPMPEGPKLINSAPLVMMAWRLVDRFMLPWSEQFRRVKRKLPSPSVQVLSKQCFCAGLQGEWSPWVSLLQCRGDLKGNGNGHWGPGSSHLSHVMTTIGYSLQAKKMIWKKRYCSTPISYTYVHPLTIHYQAPNVHSSLACNLDCETSQMCFWVPIHHEDGMGWDGMGEGFNMDGGNTDE